MLSSVCGGLSEQSPPPRLAHRTLVITGYFYIACSSVKYLIALFPPLSLDFSFDLFIISEILLYAVVKMSSVYSLAITNVKFCSVSLFSGTSFERFDRTLLLSVEQYTCNQLIVFAL